MSLRSKLAAVFSLSCDSKQKLCSCTPCPTQVTRGGVVVICPERVAKLLKENGTLEVLRRQRENGTGAWRRRLSLKLPRREK